MNDLVTLRCPVLIDPHPTARPQVCKRLEQFGRVVVAAGLDSAVDIFEWARIEPLAFFVRGSLQAPFFREVVMATQDEFNGWPDTPVVFLEENPFEPSSYEWGYYLDVEVCNFWDASDLQSKFARAVSKKELEP